jgi:hypothetical protein
LGERHFGVESRIMPFFRRQIGCCCVVREGWFGMTMLALLASAGCAHPAMHEGKSLLSPVQLSSDSVVLDLFFIRFPFGDSTVNNDLWREIDEQQFPLELREQLGKNGFRAGMINGQMPTKLAELLALSDKPVSHANTGEIRADDTDVEPRVVCRHLQLRAAQRSEILASNVYPELPVLMNKSGQISGQTYNQAQGVFAAKALPQSDGRVRVELTPEVHHDQPRPRWTGVNGVLQLEPGRPRESYDDLKLSADMRPGTMMILSGLPNRPGSLGHYFFTETNGSLEQKLLIVRLSQTQHDGLFTPPAPLKLDQ